MNTRICDMHVHIVGFERARTGCFVRRERLNPWLIKKLLRIYEIDGSQLNETGIDERIANTLLRRIEESVLDNAVLLALDAVYDTDGKRREEMTASCVDNDFVADLANRHEKALFGASIHPYRHDAAQELERLVKLGACLIKWLPSAQAIDLDHPLCLAFYDALSERGVPLLCHVGIEHVLPGGNQKMNAPQLLRAALERGVTVIAAHCGARLFLTESDYFRHWARLVKEYPNLYGDISAFGFPLRRLALNRIFRDKLLSDRILFGSDFPSPTLSYSYLGMAGYADLRRASRLSNPFDKAVETFRATGVPDEVFSRAYRLLRLDTRIESADRQKV